MKRGLFFFCLGCLFCLWFLPAAPGGSDDATGPAMFILEEPKPGYGEGWFDLSEYTDLLPDPDGALTFEEVTSARYSDRFQPYSALSKKYDPDVEAHWVRLTLLSSLEKTEVWNLYFLCTEIELYTPDGTGGHFIRRSGLFVPRSEKDTEEAIRGSPVFPLVVHPNQAQTLYWRIEDSVRFNDVPQCDLCSGEIVRKYERDHRLQIGIFAGFALAIGLYHLFLWVFLRDRSYFWFALYCMSIGTFWLYWWGYAYEFVLPEHPLILHSIASWLLAPLMFAALIRFAQTYLDTRRWTPRLNATLWGLIVLYVTLFAAFSGLRLFDYRNLLQGVAAGGIVQALLVVAAAIICFRRGYRPAGTYLLAFSTVNVGAVVFYLDMAGILSLGAAARLIYLGCNCAAFVLFALGLVDRIRLLRREKANAVAESVRKRQELEQARQLQLSMLPDAVPEIPEVKFAVHMRTASEVGGDYYDFRTADDGSVTAVIGDATGHGMRAGTMVATTKGSFAVLAHHQDLAGVLNRISSEFRSMGLTGVNMALAIARIRGRRVRLVSAGMPYPLLYQAAVGHADEVILQGPPLGILDDYPYESLEIGLEPGDALLLMSDGFPEMLSPKGEFLGFDRALEIFEQAGDMEPEALIDHLVRAGETWAQGRPQEDDVTFLVIRGTGL